MTQDRLKDFNLSEKRHRNAYEDTNDLDWIYDEKDIKKFIKILKKNLWKHKGTFEGVKCKTCLPLDWVEDEIDKLAGNELI